MSNFVLFTLLLLLTKVSSSNRQPLTGDFPRTYSSHSLHKIEPVNINVLDFRNVSTKSVSQGFARTSVVCSDSEFKSNKLNLLNLKTTHSSTKNLDNGEHKVLSGFNRNEKSNLVSSWYFEVLKGIFYILKRCQSDVKCYQKRILNGMDRMVEMKSIKLADGVFLVKGQDEEVSNLPRDSETEPFVIALTQRIIRILETHALRVRLGIMKENETQGRLRHHSYRHAFPMMVGSFMLLASFMVPMGFQFLAVVGGKALVLSQIALVMAMGSMLQRYFGFGSQKQGNIGGIVQHEYYMRDDVQPWQRQGAEDKHQQTTYPHRHLTDHQQLTMNHQQLTQQQLQGLMNYHQP